MNLLPRLLILLCLCGVVQGQTAPDTLWTKCFSWLPNGPQFINRPDLLRADSAGYLLSGTLQTGYDGDRSGSRYYLRLTLQGDTVWTQQCSGRNGAPIARCIECGFPETRKRDALLERRRRWISVSGTDTIFGQAALAVRAADGGWFLSGLLKNPGRPAPNTQFLQKTDSSGTGQWLRGFDEISPGNHTTIQRLFALPDGGVMAVGSEFSSLYAAEMKIKVLRLTSQGDTVWVCRSSGVGMTFCLDAALLPDESVAVLSRDAVFKVSPAGAAEWLTRSDKIIADFESRIVPLPEGYLVVGTPFSEVENNGPRIYVNRLDAAGKLLWSTSYAGSTDCVGSAAAAAPDGGYLIAGVWNATLGIIRLSPDPKATR